MSLSGYFMNWEEPKKRGWLNARVIAWAVFDIGATIFSMNVLSRYFGLWAKDAMGGSVLAYNATVSGSMAVAGLLQILLSPISDELGRRRVFVMGFTLLGVLACASISFAPTLGVGLMLFFIANLGYQTGLVFYNAMLGDVSDEYHRARISGIGVGLGYIGTIIGLLVSAKFSNADRHDYSQTFWVTAGLVLLFSLPLFLFVKEKPSYVRLDFGDSLKNSVGSFMTTLRRIVRHREMLFFFIACLLVLDAVHTVILNMTLYCKDVVGLDAMRGIDWSLKWKDRLLLPITITEMDLFLIVSATFGIFGSFVIGHLADKTSHYKAMLGVLILWMVALVLAMFSVQRKMFWITGPLFGLGFGGIWTVSRAYLLDLCHPEERGQMFAIYGLVGKGAAIFGPLVWGGVFTVCEPYLGERKSYRMAIGAILILLMLGSWVMLYAKPKAENIHR